MGYYSTRGLRGSSLEELVNRTNTEYLKDELAVMQKVPTAIKPVELDSRRGVITLAYFDEKSTVDYVGNVQGIPVCFDAKETSADNLPLHNIHAHQMDFMGSFSAQNGISFILVSFTKRDRYFILNYDVLKTYWDEANAGGRKSIPFEAFDEELEVKREGRYLVHYLPALEKILEREINEDND